MCKRLGMRSTVKLIFCLRILRTVNVYEYMYDSECIRADTMLVCFQRFVRDMDIFYGDYLLNRRTNADEIAWIIDKYTNSGFPGCRE